MSSIASFAPKSNELTATPLSPCTSYSPTTNGDSSSEQSAAGASVPAGACVAAGAAVVAAGASVALDESSSSPQAATTSDNANAAAIPLLNRFPIFPPLPSDPGLARAKLPFVGPNRSTCDGRRPSSAQQF